MESMREAKKRRTRDALATKALDLFLSQGFTATTVRQIAEAAGASPRTFFRYFPSKEAVVFGDLDAYEEMLDESLAARPATESPVDALCAAVVEVCDTVEASEDWRDIVFRRMRLAAAEPEVNARHVQAAGRFAERLARQLAARAGRRRSRIDEHALAHAATAILLHAAREWAAADGKGSLAARVRDGFVKLQAELRPRTPR